MASEKVLTMSTLNPHIVSTDYTPDENLHQIAERMEREQREENNNSKRSLIRADTDDPKALGQQPITFVRQLIASVCLPSLHEYSLVPEDVQRKAEEFLGDCDGSSIGSYSDNRGIEVLRKRIAEFIQIRDGTSPPDYDAIQCTNGGEHAVREVLKFFINEFSDIPQGVMCPLPCESFLQPALSEYGLEMVGYTLFEQNGWHFDERLLEEAYAAKNGSVNIRALYICNPGNPTGQVLTRQSLEAAVRFAHTHRLFILANEEYQDSIIDPTVEFTSCRKVIMTMELPFNSVELASVHSASYGYVADAGHRGSYIQFHNADELLPALCRKMGSLKAPSMGAQATLFAMLNRPTQSEPSYEQWRNEKEEIENTIRQNAKILVDGLNRINGIHCGKIEAGRFALPSIDIPSAAVEKATNLAISPCQFYATQLLHEQGVLVSPERICQIPINKFYLKIVVHPQTDQVIDLLKRITVFHDGFTAKYSTPMKVVPEETATRSLAIYG